MSLVMSLFACSVTPQVPPAAGVSGRLEEHAPAHGELRPACEQGDVDACLALAAVEARAWAASGAEDCRRRAGFEAFLGAACDGGHAESCRWLERPVPEELSVTWVASVDVRPLPTEQGWTWVDAGRFHPLEGELGSVVVGPAEVTALGPGRYAFWNEGAREYGILDASGWRVERTPDDEPICSVHAKGEAYMVVTNRSLPCEFSRATAKRTTVHDGSRYAHATGFANGRFSLQRASEDGGWILRELDQEVALVPFSSVQTVSGEGQVVVRADGSSPPWERGDVLLWSRDEEPRELPIPGGAELSWARGHLFAFQCGELVEVDLEGHIIGEWTLPRFGCDAEVEVHPDGTSIRMRRNSTATHHVYRLGDTADVVMGPPAWLDALPEEAHYLPVPDPQERVDWTVVDGRGPVDGAAWEAEPPSTTPGVLRAPPGLALRRRCGVRVDGLCQEVAHLDPESRQVTLKTVRVVVFPDSRDWRLVPLDGPEELIAWRIQGALGLLYPVGRTFAAMGQVELPLDGGTPLEHGVPDVQNLHVEVTDDGVITKPLEQEVVTVVDASGWPLAGLEVTGRPGAIPVTDLRGRARLMVDDLPLASCNGTEVALASEGRVVVGSASAETPWPSEPVEPSLLWGHWRVDAEDEAGRPLIWSHVGRTALEPFGGVQRREAGTWDDVRGSGVLVRRMISVDALRSVVQMDIRGEWESSARGPVRVYDFVEMAKLPTPSGQSSGKRFVGRFGWEEGDRVVRTIREDDGTTWQSTGEVRRVADDQLELRWSTSPDWPTGRTAPEESLVEPIVFREEGGWFVTAEVDPDRGTVTPTEAIWRHLVQDLSGRELDAGLRVEEAELRATGGPQPRTLLYNGRVPCDAGRCASLTLTFKEGEDLVQIEAHVTDGLRPVWRRMTSWDGVFEETWAWEGRP